MVKSELGERCEKTEECASLLCVRLDESSGVCSNCSVRVKRCWAEVLWGRYKVADQKELLGLLYQQNCAQKICRPFATH